MTLKIKTTKDDTYDFIVNGTKVIWEDYLYFQITSIPSDYVLELMEIIVTTDSEAFTLDEMFIDTFIQNMNNTVDGELTFGIMISDETGLSQGLN